MKRLIDGGSQPPTANLNRREQDAPTEDSERTDGSSITPEQSDRAIDCVVIQLLGSHVGRGSRADQDDSPAPKPALEPDEEGGQPG